MSFVIPDPFVSDPYRVSRETFPVFLFFSLSLFFLFILIGIGEGSELYSPYIIGSSGSVSGDDDLEAEQGKLFLSFSKGEKFYDDPVFFFRKVRYIGGG